MLSGPVEGVDDSKKLTEKRRETLYEILQRGDHQIGVSIISSTELDEMGLQPANYAAMARAAEQLSPEPQILLVDGFKISGCRFMQQKIIKGDQKSQSIAAASIIAKVTRDRIMVDLDSQYPVYGFARHKGYGTKAHLEAINRHGSCPVHRQCFAPIARVQETGSLF
jgi:ribonuclease HII